LPGTEEPGNTKRDNKKEPISKSAN